MASRNVPLKVDNQATNQANPNSPKLCGKQSDSRSQNRHKAREIRVCIRNMNVHNRSLHASLTAQPFIESKDKTQLYNLNMKLYRLCETKTKKTKHAED